MSRTFLLVQSKDLINGKYSGGIFCYTLIRSLAVKIVGLFLFGNKGEFIFITLIVNVF